MRQAIYSIMVNGSYCKNTIRMTTCRSRNFYSPHIQAPGQVLVHSEDSPGFLPVPFCCHDRDHINPRIRHPQPGRHRCCVGDILAIYLRRSRSSHGHRYGFPFFLHCAEQASRRARIPSHLVRDCTAKIETRVKIYSYDQPQTPQAT